MLPFPAARRKLDRIEEVLDRFPDRAFAFDEFGPLGIRPTAGSGWAGQGHPNWLPATYHKERARIRGEKGIRWGGHPLKTTA